MWKIKFNYQTEVMMYKGSRTSPPETNTPRTSFDGHLPQTSPSDSFHRRFIKPNPFPERILSGWSCLGEFPRLEIIRVGIVWQKLSEGELSKWEGGGHCLVMVYEHYDLLCCRKRWRFLYHNFKSSLMTWWTIKWCYSKANSKWNTTLL